MISLIPYLSDFLSQTEEMIAMMYGADEGGREKDMMIE